MSIHFFILRTFVIQIIKLIFNPESNITYQKEYNVDSDLSHRNKKSFKSKKKRK